MIRISGKNVTLALKEDTAGGSETLWGCCRQLTITGQTELLEITPLIGRDLEFIPTYSGETIEASGLYLLFDSNDNTMWNSLKFWQWRKNRVRLSFAIKFSNEDGSLSDTYKGKCYLVGTSAAGNNNEAAVMNISLQVTGAMEMVGGGTGISCPAVTWERSHNSLIARFYHPAGATNWAYELKQGATVIESGTFLTGPGLVTREFEGLTAQTNYNLTLTYTFPNSTSTCNYSASTTALPQSFPHTANLGNTQAAACQVWRDGWALFSVYSDNQSLQIGTRLYLDAAMTQPLNQQYMVNSQGFGFRVNTANGEIVEELNTCPPI